MTYFIYFLCAFFTGCQIWNIYQYKHMGGDRAVGQAWLMLMLGVIFLITTLLLFFMMSRKGCFTWLNEHFSRPNLIIALFCLCYIISVFFSGTFKIEWHSDGGYPMLLRYLSKAHVYLWIPLCVLVPFYFLIKNGGEIGMNLSYVKYPLYVGIILSGLYSGLCFYGWVVDRVKTSHIMSHEKQEIHDRYHLQNLETIEKYAANDNISGLLSYSFVARPKDIHEAALKKIKERTDWEEQILQVLKNRELYKEAYYFLCGNSVSHKEQFKEPLRQSIVSLSVDVGEFLKEANNFQDWTLDHFNIPLMLEALDFHFKGEASYFSDNVLKLKNAIQINTPREAAKLKFNAMRSIDGWIKKNKIQE